jgi:hypothetical protein
MKKKFYVSYKLFQFNYKSKEQIRKASNQLFDTEFFTFFSILVTDIIQKQVSLYEWNLPKWPKPNLLIGEVNDTERNRPVACIINIFWWS